LEETSHPVKTSLVIRASRRDEIVAFTTQRVDVLLPELSSLLWGHVGLTGFVGPEANMSAFVHVKNRWRVWTYSFMPRT
jgi:hypothetical protein